jgi:hypothetical protein
MKTFKIFTLLAFVILLFSSSSCDSDDLKNRPEGDGTLSCLINGKLFFPKSSSNITSTLPTGNGLRILINERRYQFTAKDFQKYTISFNLVDVGNEIVNLEESSGSFHDYSLNHALLRINSTIYISKQGSGSVTFIENSAENIKGTFEFTLYNEDDENDVIRVTDGRFDD